MALLAVASHSLQLYLATPLRRSDGVTYIAVVDAQFHLVLYSFLRSFVSSFRDFWEFVVVGFIISSWILFVLRTHTLCKVEVMIHWLDHWDNVWMLVYRIILGVVWCGRVQGTMQCKMLLEKRTIRVFVMKLIVYIECNNATLHSLFYMRLWRCAIILWLGFCLPFGVHSCAILWGSHALATSSQFY